MHVCLVELAEANLLADMMEHIYRDQDRESAVACDDRKDLGMMVLPMDLIMAIGYADH